MDRTLDKDEHDGRPGPGARSLTKARRPGPGALDLDAWPRLTRLGQKPDDEDPGDEESAQTAAAKRRERWDDGSGVR